MDSLSLRVDKLIRALAFGGDPKSPIMGPRVTLAEVVEILDAGANVDTADSSGMTLLQWAARRGYMDIVNVLLDRGAKVNRGSPPGFAALHFAAEWPHVDMLRRLLAAGGDPNQRDKWGNGVLSSVGASTSLERWTAFRDLIRAGADPRRKNDHGVAPLDRWYGVDRAVALHFSEKGEPSRELPWLVLAMDRPGLEAALDAGSPADELCHGITALHIAASIDESMTRLLLERGANPNHRDDVGFTPMHHAAQQMNVGILRALVAHGGDASREGNLVQPIHYASFLEKEPSEDTIEIANLLLGAGADPSEVRDGHTPMKFAAPKLKALFKRHLKARATPS